MGARAGSVVFEHAHGLQKAVHAQRREEPRGAAGGQHMVRAGQIVPQGFRRTRPPGRPLRRSSPAGSRALGSSVMISRCSGAISLASSTQPAPGPGTDDGAPEVPQGLLHDLRAAAGTRSAGPPPGPPPGPAPSWSVSSTAEASRSCSAWLSRSAATYFGSAGLVGNDQHLRGAGHHVDVQTCRRPAAWRRPHRRCQAPPVCPPGG